MSAAGATRLAFQRAGAQATDFFAWWLQEVREARLALMERLSSQRSQRFVLELSADGGVLSSADGGQIPFALDATGELPKLQDVWPEGAPRKARADIVLPDSSVLVFTLRLPPVSEREVGNVVALQFERELPLPIDQVYVDWRVREKLEDQSRVVDVAMARSAQVHRWRDAVRSWGWRVSSIGCKDSAGKRNFNLLPAPVQRVSFDIGRRELALTLSALVLGAAYLLIVAGQWWHERSSLSDSIQQARTQVRQIEDLRATLERERQPLLALREIMEQSAAGHALAAMSAALPRDTWLNLADIRVSSQGPTTVSMEGYTSSATTLAQLLEQSANFERVELVELVNAAPGAELDRIKLKALLRAGGQE